MDDLKGMFATLKKYQMRLNPGKCVFGVVSRPGIHGVPKTNRSKPRESASHHQHDVTQDRQGSSKTHRKDSSFKQVRLQSYRQMSTLFQDLETGFRLDRQMRSSVLGTKALPEQSTPLKPVQRRGRPILIPGSVSLSSKCNPA